MNAGYCLYVHIFLKSLKPFNFNNSIQLMPDLYYAHSFIVYVLCVTPVLSQLSATLVTVKHVAGGVYKLAVLT